MATTNDLKNGMTLSIDGALWSVVEFQHVKPGKGGAFVRTKLKNVLSGKVVDRVPVTVEPGVYLPGKGGVRIEDTLVVRAGSAGAAAPGPAQILTTTTRELLVL